MKKLAALLLLSLAATAMVRATVTITPGQDGLQVVGDGDTLKFKFSYPTLSTGDKKKTYSANHVDVKDGNTAILLFTGGGELDIAIDATGTITIKGENLPADVASISMRMMISQSFNVGGTYQFGSNPAKPFPETKPDKPHLFQGNPNPDTLTIRDGSGKGILITVPQFSYQEVTDMREWNTNAFGWMTLANISGDAAVTYKIEDAPPAPAAAGDASTNAAPTMQ